eukprot:Platyproteum_vivax@DN7579_c0_g1_i7.p1
MRQTDQKYLNKRMRILGRDFQKGPVNSDVWEALRPEDGRIMVIDVVGSAEKEQADVTTDFDTHMALYNSCEALAADGDCETNLIAENDDVLLFEKPTDSVEVAKNSSGEGLCR